MCCLIFDCVSLGFECKTERNNIRPFYCMNSQNEKNEKDIYYNPAEIIM